MLRRKQQGCVCASGVSKMKAQKNTKKNKGEHESKPKQKTSCMRGRARNQFSGYFSGTHLYATRPCCCCIKT